MQLILGFEQLPEIFKQQGCALTIGNFDGVHLGHQAILARLREQASALNLPMVVMLFEPQPAEYFLGQQAPARLMRLRDKLYYLDKAKVDYVLCIRFNHAFAQLSARQFIEDYLLEKLHVKYLSIGDDFRFGANRSGDFEMLQQAANEFAFMLEKNQSFCLSQQRISSTAIRQALAEDNLKLAKQLLGRPYCIYGRVAHGHKLGRTLGFPTANIPLQRQVNPLKGVYAVRVKLESGDSYNAVANIGTRPTVNGIKQLLEVYIFDFNQNIYRQQLQVEFCHKLRNEIKFSSFDALKHQIAQDVLIAKAYFSQ